MSAPMTREERTQRLADLRARMAARHVILSGGPLMSLPLHRRVAFAISDPGAITPHGNDYQEPLHVWQARAVAFVLPEATEVEVLRARVAELEAGSPWERAVAGLNALADADIAFWIEPDGHISGPFGDEHIEWNQETSRWVLTRDEDVPPVPAVSAEDAARAAVDRSITDQFPATAADRWNALYPVGTPVYAYPGCRPEDDPKCTRLTTRTRSAASVLGGHTAVVWVEGHSACISLTHVDPRPEDGAL